MTIQKFEYKPCEHKKVMWVVDVPYSLEEEEQAHLECLECGATIDPDDWSGWPEPEGED